MNNPNLSIWLEVCRPPESALKQIKGGRLKGMTDISPQWRYKILTEMFGPVGYGWKYRVIERWKESDTNGQIACFVSVALNVRDANSDWSDDIVGTGGSMLIAEENKTDYETKEKTKVLYLSDEAYKMAETDALSVAMKQLGVGADIYMGMFDGSKYTRPKADIVENISDAQLIKLNMDLDELEADKEMFCKIFGISSLADLPSSQWDTAQEKIARKRAQKEQSNA